MRNSHPVITTAGAAFQKPELSPGFSLQQLPLQERGSYNLLLNSRWRERSNRLGLRPIKVVTT
jgi:hypothetical protein